MPLTKIDDRGLKTPIDLLDNEKIRLGTGNDLQLYHDGSHSNIVNSTGELKIRGAASQAITFRNGDDSANVAVFNIDDATHLYFDSAHKFSTTSTGIKVVGNCLPNSNDTGQLGTSSIRWQELNITDVIDVSDNGKIRMGDGDDLQTYHDGTNDFIQSNGGYLKIQTDSLKIHDRSDDHPMITAVNDGAVELYYNNSKKLETKSDGVFVSGAIRTNAATSGAGSANQATFDYNSYDTRILSYNTTGSSINLFTNENGGSLASRLTVTSTGKVGMGHTSPGSFSSAANRLVVSTNSGNCGISINASATNANSNLFFTDGTGSGENGAGRVSYEHQNDALALFTDSTERMRIDNAGRLLIGTITEGFSGADNLTIEDSGHCGITIRSGATSDAQVSFSDATSGAGEYAGQIVYDHTDNFMMFRVNGGSEAMRINSNGHVTIPSQPCAVLHNAVDRSNPMSASTYNGTPIQFSSVHINQGGMSVSNTNSRITVPTAGIYLCSGMVAGSGSGNSPGDGWQLNLYRNGSSYPSDSAFPITAISTSDGEEYSIEFTIIVNCSANDYLEIAFANIDSQNAGLDRGNFSVSLLH